MINFRTINNLDQWSEWRKVIAEMGLKEDRSRPSKTMLSDRFISTTVYSGRNGLCVASHINGDVYVELCIDDDLVIHCPKHALSYLKGDMTWEEINAIEDPPHEG